MNTRNERIAALFEQLQGKPVPVLDIEGDVSLAFAALNSLLKQTPYVAVSLIWQCDEYASVVHSSLYPDQYDGVVARSPFISEVVAATVERLLHLLIARKEACGGT